MIVGHPKEEGSMKRLPALAMVMVAILVLASCAPGPNDAERISDAKGRISGFWLGLWHGLISPITFIISLFTKNVRFYDVHNNGGWYNFGFVLGAGLFLSGGVLGRKRKRR
jgi:hypothetical protein